ncbi:MAG: hypothetical protein HY300_00655 [Verrucomicrobia bacterium]|nr:hypothetical protein [Verrucomicrobiota bacterium]
MPIPQSFSRCLRFLAAALLLSACASPRAEGPQGRVVKVLMHRLDLEGRHTLSPSLFERDAYQVVLRKHPEQVSAVRFDVQWKARVADPSQLRLKLEVLGAKSSLKTPFVLEQPVTPDRWGETWSALLMNKETFLKVGEPAAWRVSLWDREQLLGEQKSFVW